MYKNILIPTDGSELSESAASHALELAKLLGSKVTVLTVTAPWGAIAIGEIAVALPQSEYEDRADANANAFLKSVTDAAAKAGVACDSVHVRETNPYQAIVRTADEKGCDLIVMGSHGRRGIEGFLLGSETVDVLTHSKVPVLVYR
ncbi:MAG: universal stress protein [Hyphomicrobiaceae bacterium]|nr:universal stress protein [Hyphomicrobiaceae bacterium]